MEPSNNVSIVDPLLKKTEQGIEKSVRPELRDMYDFIIENGSAIMYDQSMTMFVKKRMDSSQNPALNAANGAADLIEMVYRKWQTERNKRGDKPISKDEQNNYGLAALSACIFLMCQILDMAEKIGKIKLTKDIIERSVQNTYKITMAKFGISQEAVRLAISQQQAGK